MDRGKHDGGKRSLHEEMRGAGGGSKVAVPRKTKHVS